MKKSERINDRYQLRYAAGIYWLLDMKQNSVFYKKPFAMNEFGLEIWRSLSQGLSEEEIAEKLSAECRVDKKIVLEDIAEFREKLEKNGIMLDGE